jgi:hypothetical protein
MADFSIRSDSVNVEEIMRQIRARIQEKRGVDYTEQQIRELAEVKLEKFLDPSKVRSDLLEQYRELQQRQMQADAEVVDEISLFGSPRPWLRRLRRWLRPVLKLFLNPVALTRASRVNVRHTDLLFEIVHNLVVETTRLNIEVKTLKMRVESLSSRLDFDERRARALEGAVQYRPGAAPQEAAPPETRKDEDQGEGEGPAAARSRRRRRRRGRRGGGPRTGPETVAAGTENADEDERAAVAELVPGDEGPGAPSGERRDDEDRGSEPSPPMSSARSETPTPQPRESSGNERVPSDEQHPGRHEPGD